MSRSNWYKFIAASIVGIIVIWCYYPTRFYFLNDDFIHIPKSAAGEFGQRNSIRPFNDFTLYIDSLIWHKSATGFHLTNLLLHLANCFLIYVFSLQLFKQFSKTEHKRLQSFLIALFFAAYSFHGEGVFWAIGRTAPQSTFFMLISVIGFMQRKKSVLWLAVSIISFYLGLFTYESVIVAPFFMGIVSYMEYKNKRKHAKLQSDISFFVIFGASFILYLVYRFMFLGEFVGRYEADKLLNFSPLSLFLNVNRLIARSFLPPMESTKLFIVCYVLCVGIFAAMIFMAARVRSLGKAFWALILCFLFSLVPYISIGISTHDTESERYLYLPSVFFCIIIVQLIFKLFSTEKVAIAVVGGLVVFHLFFLYQSANNYEFTGNVAKVTYAQINKLEAKQNLYIYNLPSENRGAILFRLGFEYGLDWLKKENTVFDEKILSLGEMHSAGRTQYPVIQMEQLPDSTRLQLFYSYSDEQMGYVLQKNLTPTFDRAKDALFIFTDSALLIYK
jgi:hypothetical protein